MAVNSVQTISVTNAGGTVTLDANALPGTVYLTMQGGSVTLASNFTLDVSAALPVGTRINVLVGTGLDLNGNTFSVLGYDYTTGQQASNTLWWYMFQVVDGPSVVYYLAPYDFNGSDFLSGLTLIDGTVAIDKLVDVTAGQIILGNSSNRPTATAVTGDVTITSGGVTAIGAGVIVNADVNASADIARGKIDNGTAGYVVINDGATGYFSEEQYLDPARGGLGLDASAATGFVTYDAGTSNVGAIANNRDIQVSWETGYVGDFKIRWGFDGTCTGLYAFLAKAVGAADATITPKNQAGTTLTDGVITFTASDPKGTAETSTPTANNTFVTGDVWTFTTAGGSAAGVAQLTIDYTRTS